jgi:hypothetical protein
MRSIIVKEGSACAKVHKSDAGGGTDSYIHQRGVLRAFESFCNPFQSDGLRSTMKE